MASRSAVNNDAILRKHICRWRGVGDIQGWPIERRLPVNIGPLLVGLLCVGGRAVAISPADRDIIQQQQTEQLNQNDQQRQDLQRVTPLSASPAQAAACFYLDTIILQGADTLPASVRQRLTAPCLHQCVGLTQINTLVKQVLDW